jgi:hypothetical protein
VTCDRGFCARPLSDRERSLEKLVEDPAERPFVGSDAEGLPYLPEDLRLTDHHRVRPGRDVEQVPSGIAVVVGVEAT